MMQLKQLEVRLSDEAFLLKYGARDSMLLSVLINYNISMSLSDLPYDVLSIIAMRMTSTATRDRRCSQ
jgi:hypothetical protein